ncbi:MAG: insulinase family protein [Gammaproteobacteria bacterium]|nr:insulinase family protein [Gammaproteobacteria bacterium]MBT3722586.1 insulinase family protein [Gammaproteobacteria bacterium]MBT4077908.1 insulinase family protein [Gammaproteobacteria bacterium]MBT4193206.1 insulinase family protein [Gammaproteobacteria bacterium]MBT4451083.1 insulinase family protein [Gammaproteobacteria bacterium]
MKKDFLYFIILLLMGCAQYTPVVTTQNTTKEEIFSLDKEIIHGKLSNGLEYFIKKNPKPENRVNINLAIKVGSLQDPEGKQGLAHYVEHMAFNGTKNFPENKVIKDMEALGMAFGQHTNAETAFDRTLYKLTVPSDEQGNIEKALSIMMDWSENISFDEQDVIDEQGVVLEEWRKRRLGVAARSQQIRLEHLLKDSRYIERIPIGSEESIKNITRKDLVTFYKKWYQPQNMAIIVVGDIDPLQLEELIQNKFSSLKPVRKITSVKYDIPLVDKQDVFNFDDAEISTGLSIYYHFTEQNRIRNKAGWRFKLNRELFCLMFNQRAGDIALTKNAPFIAAGAIQTALPDGREGVAFFVSTKNSDFETAYSRIQLMIKQIDKYGFNNDELIRAKKGKFEKFKHTLRNEKNLKSTLNIKEISHHFLYKTPALSVKDEVDLSQKLLDKITLNDVNEFASFVINSPYKFLYSQSPTKDKNELLLAENYNELNQDLQKKQIEPYDGTLNESEFWLTETKPGKIISEEWISELKTFRWVLSNGAEVFFKPTDFKKNKFFFNIFSEGGFSSVSDEWYRNALGYTSILATSGIGERDFVDLRKILSTKNMSFNYEIRSLFHGISGWSASDNIDTVLQLGYLSFVQPRVDEVAIDRYRFSKKDNLVSRKNIAKSKFKDEFLKFYLSDHFRAKPWSIKHLDELDKNIILDIHEKLFSNARNFKFVFVGDIDKKLLMQDVEKYIASLPSNSTKLTWVDLNKTTLPGEHEFSRYYLNEDRADIAVEYNNIEEQWTEEEQQFARHLARIVQVKLGEALREELSGTYSVYSSVWARRVPSIKYGMQVKFSCDPDNVDSLIAKTDSVLQNIADGQFSDQLLENEKERWLKQRESNLQDNKWWMSMLTYILKNNKSISRVKEQDKLVRSMTKNDIKKLAKKILQPNNKMVSILLPKLPRQARVSKD